MFSRPIVVTGVDDDGHLELVADTHGDGDVHLFASVLEAHIIIERLG